MTLIAMALLCSAPSSAPLAVALTSPRAHAQMKV